jgi:GTPase SAR1 family protein
MPWPSSERSYVPVRVAIVGNQGVGKTTLLNALLYEHEPDVFDITSLNAVHEFVLKPHKEQDDRQLNKRRKLEMSNSTASLASNEPPMDDDDIEFDVTAWSLFMTRKEAEERIETALDLVDERLTNRRYYGPSYTAESEGMTRHVHTLFVDDYMIDMRDDFELRITDIPGLDKDDDITDYTRYVSAQWKCNDCCIIVVDGTKYENREEHIKLFKFVKENQEKYRTVPIIIAINKADKLSSPQIREAIVQIRLAYETAYKSPSVDPDKTTQRHYNSFHPNDPEIIPISAAQSCVRQTAFEYDYSSMEKIDSGWIETIGRRLCGDVIWQGSSMYTNYRMISMILLADYTNGWKICDGITAQLTKTLEEYVGRSRQIDILCRNVRFQAQDAAPSEDIMPDVYNILPYSSVLGDLKFTIIFDEAFEILVEKSTALLFDKFQKTGNTLYMSRLMEQIQKVTERISPRSICRALLVPQLKRIVHIQYEMLICTFAQWQERRDKTLDYYWDWMILSPFDWERIFRAILLPSDNGPLVESFSNELLFFEEAIDQCKIYAKSAKVDHCYLCNGMLNDVNITVAEQVKQGYMYCQECNWSFSRVSDPAKCPGHTDVDLDVVGYCNKCDWHYRRPCAPRRLLMRDFGWQRSNNIQLMRDPSTNSSVLTLPNEISDPSHVGYISWMFCQLIRDNDKKEEDQVMQDTISLKVSQITAAVENE